MQRKIEPCFFELIEKINSILGYQGEISNNPQSNAKGAYRWSTDNIHFGIDDSHSLIYPTQIISEQSAQFISLLIASTGLCPDSSVVSFFKKVLSNAPTFELEHEAREIGMDPTETHLPMIITMESSQDTAADIIRSYFAESAIGCTIGKLGYYMLPLKKISIDSNDRDALEELGRGLSELLNEEGTKLVRIAFASPTGAIHQWFDAFHHAKAVLKAGLHFYPKCFAYFSWQLDLELMLSDLPELSVKQFIQAILGDLSSKEWDHELFATIQTLWEENLNMSETARKLFIHRNTLMYRVERFKTETGRDLRIANQAHLVFIAMLLWKGFHAD